MTKLPVLEAHNRLLKVEVVAPLLRIRAEQLRRQEQTVPQPQGVSEGLHKRVAIKPQVGQEKREELAALAPPVRRPKVARARLLVAPR
jgi:hypothetical protein